MKHDTIAYWRVDPVPQAIGTKFASLAEFQKHLLRWWGGGVSQPFAQLPLPFASMSTLYTLRRFKNAKKKYPGFKSQRLQCRNSKVQKLDIGGPLNTLTHCQSVLDGDPKY